MRLSRCQHAYGHASTCPDFHRFPWQLRGADAGLYASAVALGLSTSVVPHTDLSFATARCTGVHEGSLACGHASVSMHRLRTHCTH